MLSNEDNVISTECLCSNKCLENGRIYFKWKLVAQIYTNDDDGDGNSGGGSSDGSGPLIWFYYANNFNIIFHSIRIKMYII